MIFSISIHDRMPVVLTDEEAEKWLDVDKYSFADCKSLLRPYQVGLSKSESGNNCLGRGKLNSGM